MLAVNKLHRQVLNSKKPRHLIETDRKFHLSIAKKSKIFCRKEKIGWNNDKIPDRIQMNGTMRIRFQDVPKLKTTEAIKITELDRVALISHYSVISRNNCTSTMSLTITKSLLITHLSVERRGLSSRDKKKRKADQTALNALKTKSHRNRRDTERIRKRSDLNLQFPFPSFIRTQKNKKRKEMRDGRSMQNLGQGEFGTRKDFFSGWKRSRTGEFSPRSRERGWAAEGRGGEETGESEKRATKSEAERQAETGACKFWMVWLCHVTPF